jgi:hypothetical protein
VCSQVSAKNILFRCLGEAVVENGREAYGHKREGSQGELISLLTSSCTRSVQRPAWRPSGSRLPTQAAANELRQPSSGHA